MVLEKKAKEERYFDLFCTWILGSVSIETIVKLSSGKVSKRSLARYFDSFLDSPPQPKKLKESREIYLKCDGKYFGRWGCVLAYKEGSNIIYWNFVERENFFNYRNDFIKLNSLGFIVKGITSDWHGSIVSAAKYLWGDQEHRKVPQNIGRGIPHQRCLVHTQRQCKTLLTKHPETDAGKNLLELVSLLNQIKSLDERDVWLKWLERFEERYGEFVKQRTYGENKHWWYTHKSLRRAFLTLKSTKEHLFLYLEYNNLPKDTNGIEAEFSHLKQKLGAHRGMTRERKSNFVRWYFYLKSIYSEYKN